MHVTGSERSSKDEVWQPLWGKFSAITDRFHELTLHLEENGGQKRRLDLIARCYNDGAAFRYDIPNQPGFEHFTLTREETEFHLPANSKFWVATYKNFHSAYESEYQPHALADISLKDLLGLPALVQTGPSAWLAITEAELTDWAGMYLQRDGDALHATLAPLPSREGVVSSQSPRQSPWRVFMLASQPAALIESTLIENLSTRSALHDASWIQPGMMAWDHWWSGDVDMSFDADKRFIDFASFMGFPYQLVDWQWYGPFNKPSADITHPVPALNMPELLQYAASKHVRLWLWVHSGDIDRALAHGTLDNAFATYQRWGIAGVKIDFMQSDDQQRVRWYQQIAQLAAKHHLMVDYHGAYKPTGLSVTYPNLLTREGVLGNEYNKFSRRDTPVHKATLPFTRGLVGPMDYTPGGFLNHSPAEFRPQLPTEVMGSRANELALFIVYWSPLTCVSDDPAHYIHNGTEEPGLEFVRNLPTVWDETRALNGVVGEHVIVARRKANDWWLGGITADTPYRATIPLAFLGKGHFRAHIYRDPTDNSAPYTAITMDIRTVSAKDQLSIWMRPAGGLAIRFERVK